MLCSIKKFFETAIFGCLFLFKLDYFIDLKYNRKHLINNEYNKYMAKRSTTLGIKKKSRRSHKTKKRLEIKKLMLAGKSTGKKRR